MMNNLFGVGQAMPPCISIVKDSLGLLNGHLVVLVQEASAACRFRASRVHVAVPHRPECGAAFPIPIDLAAPRTWAVSEVSSVGRVFRLAAAGRRSPLRRKSVFSMGSVRRSSTRGFCRRRREPEPPRSAHWCRSSSKSTASSAVRADELQRNREIF